MSCVHPSLAEGVGIEAVALSHGMSCRTLAACLGPPPQHHFQHAALGQRQIRPNPAVMPGLLITGPEKEERCRAMTAA